MITKKAYFYFPKSETEKPIVYTLIKEYDLMINIFRAKVTPDEEGYLSVDITGTEENIRRGMAYLGTFDVEIYDGYKGVQWDDKRCTHCGNCTSHCPTKALAFVDSSEREMTFHEDKCIECLSCVSNCPYNVCSSRF